MSWVGAPLPRKEDARLLAGRGCYVDDLTRPGLLHALAGAVLLRYERDGRPAGPGVSDGVTEGIGQDLRGNGGRYWTRTSDLWHVRPALCRLS